MKNIIYSIAATAALFSMSATAQEEETKNYSVTLNTSYQSAYVWRGINFTNDAVLQSSATLSYKGFSLNAWASNNFTDENEQPVSAGQFEEVDYTLSYSGNATEDLSYTVGAIRYQFPEYKRVPAGDTKYTTELYTTFSYNTFLNPTLAAYYDVDSANGGLYFNASVSHSVEIYKGQNLSLGAGNSGFEFTDAAFTASSQFAVNEKVSITPSLTYTHLINGSTHEGADSSRENLVGNNTAISSKVKKR